MILPLPIDLMIVGAHKAGTSSLKNYLGEHPGICTHNREEMLFFRNDEKIRQVYGWAFQKYFQVISLVCILLILCFPSEKR